jgi:hypothetical protein
MATPMSYGEMFDAVSKIMGKPVRVQQRLFDEAVSELQNVLTSDGDRDLLPKTVLAAERMLLFYNRRGLVGNPDVLEMVLGRKATSFEEWVKGVVESARSKQ